MRTGIGSFCIRNVVTVPRDATVAEAATLMRRHHIGAVVIVEPAVGGHVPVGVLTDRDIVVEVVAAGLAPETMRVTEVVHRPVVTVAEDAGYAETVRVMSVNGVRRVPIVDGDGRLVEIIAVDDILHQLVGPLFALGDLAARERHYEMGTRQ